MEKYREHREGEKETGQRETERFRFRDRQMGEMGRRSRDGVERGDKRQVGR